MSMSPQSTSPTFTKLSLVSVLALSFLAAGSFQSLTSVAHAEEAVAPAKAEKTEAKTEKSAEKPAEKKKRVPVLPKEATIKTSMGEIKLKLFPERAPKTVENFAGLAKGTKEWTEPKSQKKVRKPLYNGTIFHRIIPGFMIQGGDPLGNGTGGPGYEFEDETSASDSFDKPGILAMANAGPNTNGSQFFITVKPTPWLNGKHTIFGEVTKGMDIVEKIVNSPKGMNDRPEKDIKIEKVTVK